MIAGGSLLAGAVLVGWLAPIPLSRLRSGPDVGLTWWLTLTVAALATAAAASVLLLFGGDEHLDGGPWHLCSAVLGHQHVHPADEIAGVLLLVVLCLAAAKAARIVRRRLAAQRRAHRAHLDALALTSLSRVDGVLWWEHDAPFAYSISGRPGLVVASTGLNRLPADQRDAVLHHEWHHLRRRHHWLVIAASALTGALPRVPLFRAFAVAARTLTELAADHRAAQDCGPQAVAGALLALGQPQRVDALSRLRLRRGRRVGAHLLALATAGILPLTLGAALLAAAVALAC